MCIRDRYTSWQIASYPSPLLFFFAYHFIYAFRPPPTAPQGYPPPPPISPYRYALLPITSPLLGTALNCCLRVAIAYYAFPPTFSYRFLRLLIASHLPLPLHEVHASLPLHGLPHRLPPSSTYACTPPSTSHPTTSYASPPTPNSPYRCQCLPTEAGTQTVE